MATFYTGVDQQRYDAGEKFLPMNRFLLNYTPYTPSTSNTGGITQAGVPQPYRGYPSYEAWLAAQGGGGDGPGQVPLGLTYDPNAVANTQAATVNNLLQARGAPIHIKGYEHPSVYKQGVFPLGTENVDIGTLTKLYSTNKYPTKTFDYEVPGTSGISEAKFPPGIMEIANYDEVFGDKTVVDSVTGKTHTLPAPERFSFPEDEDKESWYSSLFSRTPRVQGTLGTRSKAQYERVKGLPFFLGQLATSTSAFNPKSRNYNPRWEQQLNYLEGLDGHIGIDPASGLRKYGPESVLAGKNVFSLFGSNDYEEALQSYIDKHTAKLAKIDRVKNKKLWERINKNIIKGKKELGEYDEGTDFKGTRTDKAKVTDILTGQAKGGGADVWQETFSGTQDGSGEFAGTGNQGNQGNMGATQHGSSGMTKDQHAAFRAATGGRVGLRYGGLLSIL